MVFGHFVLETHLTTPVLSPAFIIPMTSDPSHITDPFRVESTSGLVAGFDPNELLLAGATLTHTRGKEYLLHYEGRTRVIVIERTERNQLRLSCDGHVFDLKVMDHRDQLLADLGLESGGTEQVKELALMMDSIS